MKNLFFKLICVLLLSACSSGVDTSEVAEIELMIAAKDYESAQSMCDEILEDDELKEIGLQDLCRLSICYVKLADNQQQEDNMAKATKCYKTATEMNADSVAAFINELPIEDEQYVMLLKNLTGSIGMPINFDDEESDIEHHNEPGTVEESDSQKKTVAEKSKNKNGQSKKNKDKKKKESSKTKKKKE